MALVEIERIAAAGVRFGFVLADAGYEMGAPFRRGLTARKLNWAVGIPRHLKVHPADVRMIWPVAGRGRPRKRHVPDILSMAAEDMLADATWQNISWRTGTKGKLKARLAAVRVRVADGPPQRIRDKGQQHLPGEEAWLIGEHMGHRLNQLCPPCATPSSNSSLDERHSDARIVENRFTTSSGASKSAKVVLGRDSFRPSRR
jgi:SRSO17 transposase